MISAVIVKKPDQSYLGFQISGHAGYADAGRDIICAAVSVLAVNTVNSLETLTSDPVRYSEEEGLLQCKFVSGCSEKSELLMDSLVLGLESIQKQYGKKYLKLSFKEV